MNFNTEHITLFDQYLSNELDAEARANFEARLEQEPEFKVSFEKYREFEQTIRDAETAEIYDRVRSWESKSGQSSGGKSPRKLWIAVAAAAAVVAVLFTIDWGGPSNGELVAQYFEPYGNVSTVRGKKETIDKGLMYYEKGEYQKALLHFENYPEDTLAIFYSGEAYLALDEYQKAVEAFDAIIAMDNLFSEVAMFHKALALVGLKEEKKAIAILEKIPESSKYNDQARSLVEALR